MTQPWCTTTTTQACFEAVGIECNCQHSMLKKACCIAKLQQTYTMPSECRCSMAAAMSWLRLYTTEGCVKPVPGSRGSRRLSRASRSVPCSHNHHRHPSHSRSGVLTIYARRNLLEIENPNTILRWGYSVQTYTQYCKRCLRTRGCWGHHDKTDSQALISYQSTKGTPALHNHLVSANQLSCCNKYLPWSHL